MTDSVQDILAGIKNDLQKANDAFTKKAEDALNEAKKAGDLSAETKGAVDKLASEFNALNQAKNDLETRLGEAEQAFARLPSQTGGMSVRDSAGQLVVKSESFKKFAANIESGKRISVPVQAALTTPNIPGTIIAPDRQAGIDVAPKQRLFIRDLIAPGRTTSNTIYWIQQTGFTNNASVVAENTTKPYSNIAFDEKITPVRTIAHLFKASKQIMDDFAQLQSTIDLELRFGLKQAEELEILFGDGTGAHLEGIIPQATAYAAPTTITGATAVDTLRLAMLQAQLARIPATGHVLHFTDWAEIELMKDTLGRYIIGNPQGTTAASLWNLPVVETELAQFLNKFLTGSFMYGAQLFDREDANVVISTENADDFEKNMITIRCEERLALAVKRPEAFIYGSLPA